MGYGLWATSYAQPRWVEIRTAMRRIVGGKSPAYTYCCQLNTNGANVGDFKKLEVWQLAHQVACQIYKETAGFPRVESFGLIAQLRRSAASIAANLAEGSGRHGDREFSRFVRISLGSATELEYHLLLCRDIGLVNGSTHAQLSGQVLKMQAMLARLARALKQDHSRSRSQRTAHSA